MKECDDLRYIVDHIFSPPQLPQHEDLDMTKEHALCLTVHRFAEAYQSVLAVDQKSRWAPITRMLRNLCESQETNILSKEFIKKSMTAMHPGDVITFPIRAQNAGIIIRKSSDKTIFESFEISPPAAIVMAAKGKLVCYYPGPAIGIPSNDADDPKFREELASFLEQMNVDVLDSAAHTKKAGSMVVEERDSAHPRYITQLLTGILHGMGEVVETTRIRKRIGDDVLWKNAKNPWRRSPVWLVIRVAMQTSLYKEKDGHTQYKAFMVFLMAGILRQVYKQGFSSDLVFCMRAKMSRRLFKLGSAAPDFVLKTVNQTGQAVEESLQEKWSMVQQEQAQAAHWAPETLDIPSDTQLSLVKSRSYISRILQGNSLRTSPYLFRPQHSPRFKNFGAFCNADLSNIFSAEPAVALADFELAVENGIDDWVDINLLVESACVTIAACITHYSAAAIKLYESNPEDQSLMLLTLFELWVALDKMAVAQCPLLQEYSPDVPLGLLERLLLRRYNSFERLTSIEKYLRGRRRLGINPIFTDEVNKKTFAVRYFKTSVAHQRLKLRIEEAAASERRKKLEELSLKNAKYEALMDKSHPLEHESRINNRGQPKHKKKRCRKCVLEAEASSLVIAVHEWPLPQDQLKAKAAIFELDCPSVFGIWRTTTYHILHDICMPKPDYSANPPVQLETFHGLQEYMARGQLPRITLASKTKSFLQSHHKTTKIPSTEDSVCVNNGLQFRLFDKLENTWAANSFDECSIIQYSILRLPTEGLYPSLQYAVDGTSHSSNHVMANQSQCPKELQLNEYIAFASLRSGSRLQWLNIARELPARTLSFHKEEVLILLMQTAWQIGHLSEDGEWEWHVELKSTEFCLILLKGLEDLMLSIEASWLEGVTMRTIIVLTIRLLAATIDNNVADKAYLLLRNVRNVTFRWTRELSTKLQQSVDEHKIREFQHRVCEMAATCRGTYDVDPDHVPSLLESPEDVAILVECAIYVHSNTPSSLTNVTTYFKRLLDRDRRLSQSLEASLCQQIGEHREGLDHAIAKIWSNYRPGSSWQQLKPPNDRWLCSTAASEVGLESQYIQFNLLEGQLLVNGKPLTRLPQTIVKHPTYTRIFGQKILDIVPANFPSMDFSTCYPIFGYQVFFVLQDSGIQLTIRTKKDSEVLELIPHDALVGDLPALLVQNYTHWLNLASSEIELRPLESPWESSSQNWRIHFSIDGHSKMHKGLSLFLIDIRSPTFQMISNYIKPLEDAENLVVTHPQSGQLLLVDLPRFRLSFFLNSENLLESQNLPGMVVDSNQSTGTMFGFSSQLVLRTMDTIAAQLPRSRRVIIPYGQLHFATHGDHVSVSVDTISQTRVKYFEYNVDTDLNRLVGNVSLMSKLYKIYIHAVSSYCLPDPLTGRTGTEEALHELSSASCLSFQNLGPAEIDILRRIASLTPERSFYPHHLEVMQKIDWSGLTPIAQHHGFFTIAQLIMDYAEQLQLFHGQSESDACDLTTRAYSLKHPHLLDRAGRRTAVFYPAEFGGLLPSNNEDVEYACRHHDAGDETFISSISNMINRWPSKLNTSQKLFDQLKQWRQLPGNNDGLTLSYSCDWLKKNMAQTQWLTLYNLCRRSSKNNNCFQLLFSFSALAYNSSTIIRALIPTLLAFATVPAFRTLDPPPWPSYDLSIGFEPQRDVLLKIVLSSTTPFQSSLEANLQANAGESTPNLAKRRFRAFECRRDSRAADLVNRLISQWPCEQPSSPSDTGSWPFDIPVLLSNVTELFRCWFRNTQLRDHVGHVQAALDRVRGLGPMRPEAQAYSCIPNIHTYPSACSSISFDQLFNRDVPNVDKPLPTVGIPERFAKYREPTNTDGLQSLLSEFRHSQAHPFRRLYGDDLDKSRRILERQNLLVFPSTIPYSMSVLTYHRDLCEKHLQGIFASIYQSLSPSNLTEETIFTAGLWPRVTPRSLLAKLAYGSDTALPSQWRKLLISFAQSMIKFQRSQRLLRWALLQNHEEFFKELENKGCQSRDEMQYVDWLLIQIDGDFIVRPIQARVAKEMIAPTSEQNTVLQLNMGEGKSSVIVPMVAAALADGQTLMRVIVLKSLSSQMFQSLVGRLSGLVNRRIFYMPFSRTVKLDVQQVQLMTNLYKNCLRLGGILVVQPEHILSFKLMGIDRLFCSTTSTNREIANALLECQKWLELVSRDILDESDEILHVRYQLVYTVGEQQLLEDHPDRWTTVQQLLALVKKHIPKLQQQCPVGVEVQESPRGCFPPLRILQNDAAALLVELVAKDALDGGLPNYPFGLFPDHIRRAALRMITEIHMPMEAARLIQKYCESSGSWKGLLLLRGLLAHGILIYSLKERRWRVDYGLTSRSLLAIPYRAKDTPALRAEFGHPDVASVLTCLSYYYGGLSDSQLDLCFELLYKLDNPAMEYQNWIHDSVPEALRQLSGVNVRDPEQRDQYLFPLFQHNHAVIDFFLSQVVFPKEAKEFPYKIATSGWDIAATRTQITTGFSGTNDNRYLLPTSISQRDPVEQLSTNAKVLSYMLQPENDHYICVQSQNGERPSSRNFLGHLVRQDPEIRILLDVGAQMLEFQNVELAEHWLSLKPDVAAVIFFGENDEPVVLTRDGVIETLISSPFNQQLNRCLVYLDDAHTRGTDLKLPRDSRAAVTLGPKVTKDRLLQGCMRMRMLGHGQSVMFFAPLEVDRKIREAAGKDFLDNIKVLDILRWAMLETCEDIQHHVPHWVNQGIEYENREDAWFTFSPSENSSVDSLKSSWLQPESKTLEMMYGITSVTEDPMHSHHFAFDVPEIRERCQMLGVLSLSDTRMDEEQEREVNHEAEIERQVERPPMAKAATHKVHAHLLTFVRTGLIPSNSSEFIPAFSPLCTLATAPLGYPWSPNLLATKDFLITIQAQFYNAESYMRPANWIISSTVQGHTILVILSPFEVNELLPNIRNSNAVHLHQYSPRVTQTMCSFDDLKFYCIPPLPPSWTPPSPELMLQLNLWAGQLYLPDYATYIRLCAFLGVYTRNEGSGSYISIQHDGFIHPAYRQGVRASLCPFTKSPLPFMKELIGLRRKGMGYLSTHLGKVLHARLLTEDDFDN